MNKKLKVLLYSNNLWMLAEGMLGPLFAVFAQNIGGSVLDISWAWAIYLMVTGFLVILFGKISDHNNWIGREKIMLMGYLLNATFVISYLFVSKPWHLFLVQIGLGMSVALTMPTWNALFAKFEDKNKECSSWGLAGGEARITNGIAILIGGLIVTFLSFKVLFVTMGIIQIINCIYLSRILKYKK
ncbi:MAG: MFS transporter [Candidatus Nanoarchaeia archaeon]